MPGTSYESAPTPSTPFPALRLKTPPPGERSAGVADQLGRMLTRARVTEGTLRQTDATLQITDATLREVNALADEALALLAARREP